MNKFTEYEASFITPQKTLLSKFNHLLEFLRKNPTINVFEYNGILTNNYMQISDLEVLEYNVELGDLIIDKNCNYAFVSTIGAETFTVGDITSFKGDKGDNGVDGATIYGHRIELKCAVVDENDTILYFTLFNNSNDIITNATLKNYLPFESEEEFLIVSATGITEGKVAIGLSYQGENEGYYVHYINNYGEISKSYIDAFNSVKDIVEDYR